MAEAETQVVEEENVEVTLDDEPKKVVSETDVSDDVEVSDTTASSDDELDNYSKGVQKRIKKLTEKYRFAERDKDEATRLAEKLKEENEQLQSRLKNLDSGFITEYGTRIESQLSQAKAAYKDAHDRGDVEKMFDAQQALSKIAIEQERHRLAKQRQEEDATATAPAPDNQVQPSAAPQTAAPDPKAQKWAEKNEWFGDDEIMTQAAYVIDKQLISEGFDGTEDEYYTQLDSRLKERFPRELGSKENEGGQRVAAASTSASRSTKQGRRTVKLSPSQVAIAKKLGVPLEEYAKYVKD